MAFCIANYLHYCALNPQQVKLKFSSQLDCRNIFNTRTHTHTIYFAVRLTTLSSSQAQVTLLVIW